MASGRIEQQIDFKVNGLKDVRDAEKLVDNLDGTKAKVVVEADAKKAQRTLDDVLDDVKRLDTQDAQIVLSLRAAAVESELSDILATVADLDGDKATIDVELERAAELRGDLDQLEAAIKELDDTKVELEVDASGAKKAAEDVDGVGKSLSGAQSVGANAIGNMTQDLTALGGVAGSAGVAFGQMGEYIADALAEGDQLGNVVKNFATFAAPLAALTVGVGLITSALEGIQKRNEAIAKASKDIAEGIADDFETIADAAGDVEVGDFADRLATNFIKTQETAGRTLAALNELGIGVDDLGKSLIALDSGDASRLSTLETIIKTSGRFTGNVDAMGLSLARAVATTEDFDQVLGSMTGLFGQAGADFVNTNRDMIEALEQLDDAGEDISLDAVLKDTKDALLNAEGGVEAFAQATRELGDGAAQIDVVRRALDILGENDAAKRAADNARDLNKAYADANVGRYTAQQAEAADAVERVTTKLRDQADALKAQIDAAQAAADSGLAFADAQDRLADATAASFTATAERNKAVKEHGAASKEAAEASANLEDATNNERDAIIEAGKAAQRLADDQAAAAGTARTAQQRVDDLNTSLIEQASTATPAARRAVYEYLIQLNGIPPEKATEILADVDAGRLADANSKLNNASSTRTAAINADANTAAAETELGPRGLTRPRTTEVTANVTVNGVTAIGGGKFRLANGMVVYEGGGVVGSEGGLAAESGSEFVTMPDGRRILLTSPTLVPRGTKVTSVRRTRAILTRNAQQLAASSSSSADNVFNIRPAAPVTVNLRLQAGVIGSRFEVERAVRRATRDGIRLTGTR